MWVDLARVRANDLAVDDGTRRRTFGALLERSHRFANFLRHDAGLVPGDRLSLLMGNRVEGIELLLGAVMAGQWVTPINWHLAEEEIDYVVADSDARLLVVDDKHVSLAERIVAKRSTTALLRVGADLDAALDGTRLRSLDLDGPAGGNMIYTSGTTGRPKGVKRAVQPTVGEALGHLARMGAAVGLDGRGPHLITGPMYHAAPLMFAVYDNANGAPIVIMPRWDERAKRSRRSSRIARSCTRTSCRRCSCASFVCPEDESAPRSDASRALGWCCTALRPMARPRSSGAMIDWWGPRSSSSTGAPRKAASTR